MVTELALFLFFFSILLVGTIEVPRYLLLGQKMERASASMADLVAQIDPAQGAVLAKINDTFNSASNLLLPEDLATKGRVIVTSVGNPTGTAEKIMWQLMSPGSFAAVSKIGVDGAVPTLPQGLVVAEGENVIIAEVVFHYEPMFGPLLYSERTIYTRSFTRPRFSNLTAVPN